MNLDALVIGAGPAGSAAALQLARSGAAVALVDRHDFPRDKICGDALIPDALNALDRLGLKDSVFARARVMNRIRIYAPNRHHADLSGECACLPRVALDDLIRTAAVQHGVEFRSGLHLDTAIIEEGMVRGAVFRGPDGASVSIRAAATMLATGANATALHVFGVCERVSPSAIAARLYVRVNARTAADFDHLCISFDQAICPGYGWIFPGPADTFNVGVGFFDDGTAPPPVRNLRTLLRRFTTTFPPAAALMARGQPIGELHGAPLRTALTGAALSRPGLLVVGEAAGLTYSFSGEGIGKALESGIVAAEIVARSARGTPADARAIAREYAERIRASFGNRFRAYKIAQDWLTTPSVANVLTWKANHSPVVKQQLEGMFQETADPRELFSASGIISGLLS